jgi:hypothetical protein
MAKNEGYKGVFENMDFGAYAYEEFPMMLTKGQGKTHEEQLVVESESEKEAAVKDGWTAPKRVGVPVSLTQKELDEKDAEIAALREQLAKKDGKAPPAPPTPPAPPAPAAAK